MFNLDKLIEMVKKGEISEKPFNIRKKSWDEEYIRRVSDPASSEQGYEVDFDAIDEDPASQQLNIPTAVSPEQQAKNQQIQNEMDLWVKNNIDSLKQESQEGYDVLEQKMTQAPETSTLDADKSRVGHMVDEIRKNPNLLSDLSSKINKALNVGLGMSNIFVGTMLAKYQKGQQSIQEAPSTEAIPVGTVPTDPTIEEDEGSGENLGYDDITMAVMETFSPDNLRRSGHWDSVLNTLSPEGKGVGSMYDVGKFTEAVEKTFGAPTEGSQFDQRMKFFLVNSHLLKQPFFPVEAPQHNIFEQVPGMEQALQQQLQQLGIKNPDVTEGLKSSVGWSSAQAGSKKSPKSIMADALKTYAEPELHEILKQLIGNVDPSIVDWFKVKLPYVGKVTGPSIDVETETSNLGQAAGLDKGKVKREKATKEEKTTAAGQIAAIVDNYLEDQLEVMDMTKDSTVSKMMAPEVDKYISLKNSLASAKTPKEKAEIEKQMSKQMEIYTTVESLNGFSNYAIRQIKKLFKDATAVSAGLKTLKPGSPQQTTLINYTNDFGKAVVPSDIVETIFLGEGKGNRDYVKDYKNKINSGEISDPYEPNWSGMVNRRIPYDAYADMYIIKSQINQAYQNKLSQRSEHSRSGEDLVSSILRDFTSNAKANQMLEDFSGVAFMDNSLEEEKKKRDFIQMTIYQAEDKEKRKGRKYKKQIDWYEACYNAREKYNQKREDVKNDPKIKDEKTRQENLSFINREEKEGEITGYTYDKKTGETKPVIAYSVLKNVKGNVGSIMWPILPGVLNTLEQSKASNIFEKNAEKAFINLFNHQAKQYERYADLGKDPNPYDPQGRTNMELYYGIKEGGVPEEIKKIVDFSKQAKMNKSDKDYVLNLNKIWGLKKRIRNTQKLLDEARVERDIHINNRLNDKAKSAIAALKNDKQRVKVFSQVPPKELPMFQKVISAWDGKSLLKDKYYLWLGIKGPLGKKNTLQKNVDKYKNQIEAIEQAIVEKEVDNAELEKTTSARIAPTASGRSYLRMIKAEYNRALSKIEKYQRIKRSSYKFASINSSIDDIILGIEKDFENLLDSLVG
jgi:hypothetical protein